MSHSVNSTNNKEMNITDAPGKPLRPDAEIEHLFHLLLPHCTSSLNTDLVVM